MNERQDSASRLIAAPRDVVAHAFETGAAWAEWAPPGGMTARMLEFEPRTGGSYRMELAFADVHHAGTGKTTEMTDVVDGTFVEFRPAERIVQRVRFEAKDPAFGGEMTLAWTLADSPGGTLVSVRAAHVPPGIDAAEHEAGLRATLANLADWVARHHPSSDAPGAAPET